MDTLRNLPGKLAGSSNEYHSLDETRTHVSAGGIREAGGFEMGDLGAGEGFWAEVASIREGIRAFETQSLDDLRTRHLRNLQTPSDRLADELREHSGSLTVQAADYRSRVAKLGEGVGKDEAKRSHWENLKAQLGRALTKWQGVEMEQRQKVRERIGRQMEIVNPDVTAEEIKAVVDTSSSSSAPQIFQQAVVGTRSAAARSALTEAQTRRAELLNIESSLVKLATLMQQVADLVVIQDSQFTTLEDTADSVNRDLEGGLGEVKKAKVSAAAARHKRKICAAIGLVLVIVLVIVVVVAVKEGRSGSSSGETTKTETETASVSTSLTVSSAAVR